MPRVVLDGVKKVFARRGAEPLTALSGLSFSAQAGECLTIVGPSGSGKTTLLRLIAGLEIVTDGEIRIDGKLVNLLPAHQRGVAMIFQSPALYPHLTVEENLGFGLQVRGCARSEIARRVGEVAETLGLTRSLAVRPAELSGGERQRVAIGRAVATRPGVLLLDEPLANIDPTLRAQLRQDILSLREKFGTTLIYVTHDHLDALLMGDDMVVLRDGALQQLGPPLQVYQSPANLFVAGFFGYPPINLFEGFLRGRGAGLIFEVTAGPRLPAVAGTGQETNTVRREFCIELGSDWAPLLESHEVRPVVLGIRPEHIGLFPAPPGRPNPAALQATVLSAQIAGADVYVTACCEGVCFVSRIPAASSLARSQQCGFKVDTASACMFEPATGWAIARP